MAQRWPHDTHEKLVAAGYRLDTGPADDRKDGIRECKYPPCAKSVIFYITPNGKEMPFEITPVAMPESGPDIIKLQPHAATCEGYKQREADRKAAKK